MKGVLYTLSAAIFTFAVVSLLSCAGNTNMLVENSEKTDTSTSSMQGNASEPAVPYTYMLGITPQRYSLFPELNIQMLYEAQAMEIVRSLSLQEKVGQLFIISLWNPDGADYSLTIGAWEKKQLQLIRPGGVILFGGNIDTEAQVRKLCSGMQEHTKIPLFIATDQEGGHIGRLYESGKIPATRIPPPAQIGSTENSDYAFLAGWITGRETAEAGLNIIFAPVADLHQSATHPVIGSRSFGAEPDCVAAMSLAFAEGMRTNGVLPVLKHFPGHGGAGADPHLGSSIDARSFEEINASDLLPFIRGIQAGIDCIMVSHVIMPNVYGNDLPASCSSFITTDLLRNKLAFRGIVFTDSVSMGAITARWDAGEAAITVVEAGADCILEPPAPQKAYAALLKAVHEGRISESRIDFSVQRILTVKLKAGIIPWDPEWGPDPGTLVFENRNETGAYRNDNRVLEKYIPDWRQINNTGIGNKLHRKINTVIREAVQRNKQEQKQ